MKREPDKEEELARYFQRHRDDGSEWETEPEPGRVIKPLSVVYSVRFTPAELSEIRRAATTRGMSASELIRTSVVNHIRETRDAPGLWSQVLKYFSKSQPSSGGTKGMAAPVRTDLLKPSDTGA